jgi:DNA-binding XRE family transcriptional regulator
MVPKITQAQLADKLGVTFQQVQKYEKGVNRLSAAMMVRIAEVLKVDVQYFFDGLPTGVRNNREIKTPVLVEMSLAAHGPRLMNAFLKMKSDKLRGTIADLAQALAQAGVTLERRRSPSRPRWRGLRRKPHCPGHSNERTRPPRWPIVRLALRPTQDNLSPWNIGASNTQSFETSAATGNGRKAIGGRLNQAKPQPKELRYSRFGRLSIECFASRKRLQ